MECKVLLFWDEFSRLLSLLVSFCTPTFAARFSAIARRQLCCLAVSNARGWLEYGRNLTTPDEKERTRKSESHFSDSQNLASSTYHLPFFLANRT